MRSYNSKEKNENKSKRMKELIEDELFSQYEENIISILLNAGYELQKKIISSLNAKMFEKYVYSAIFSCATNMMNNNQPINPYSLTEKLPRFAEEISLLSIQEVLNTSNSFFIEKLQNRYFDLLVKNAKNLNDIDIINEERNKYTDNTMVAPIHYQAQELMEYEYNNSNRILTGYKCIDDVVGAMQGGDMIVLAGAPSMGKTCIMLNFVLQMAKDGKKILLFSLEMTRTQLLNRIICNELTIPADKFRKKELNNYERGAFKKYIEEYLPKLNIEICCDYRITADKVRRIIKSSNADFVFIDYMGLIEGNTNQNSYERIGDISRNIKLTALEANKPICALHQLSRKYDDREDKMPRLSDLRDSGKIEQDADMVCFVYRPAVYKPDEYDKSDMRYIVGKNRNGVANKVIELNINLAYQKVTEKMYA